MAGTHTSKFYKAKGIFGTSFASFGHVHATSIAGSVASFPHAHIRSITGMQYLPLCTAFVKGVANSLMSLVGIATGDKIIYASRAKFTGATNSTIVSVNAIQQLTIAQLSIAAANMIIKKGNPVTYTNQLLIITYVDISG